MKNRYVLYNLVWVAIILIQIGCKDHSRHPSTQKWLMNPEMKIHMDSSKRILDEYIIKNDIEYIALALNLNDQNEKLINSSKLDPKAVIPLQEWYVGQNQLLKNLYAAKTIEEARIIIQISNQFNQFNDAFQ